MFLVCSLTLCGGREAEEAPGRHQRDTTETTEDTHTDAEKTGHCRSGVGGKEEPLWERQGDADDANKG